MIEIDRDNHQLQLSDPQQFVVYNPELLDFCWLRYTLRNKSASCESVAEYNSTPKTGVRIATATRTPSNR
jgi:hypothetical protein